MRVASSRASPFAAMATSASWVRRRQLRTCASAPCSCAAAAWAAACAVSAMLCAACTGPVLMEPQCMSILETAQPFIHLGSSTLGS